MLLLLCVELDVRLGLVENLISIYSTVTLQASLEVTLLGSANGTAQNGLAVTNLSDKGVVGEVDVLDSVCYSTFHLSYVSDALGSLHLLLQLGSLLVLLNLACQVCLNLLVFPAHVTLLVDACEHYNQQVVVVATLVEGRNITYLGILVEDPTQSFACATNTSYCVLCA